MGMDKSLICYDDSSKKTDPYGELKVFAGSSGQHLGRAILNRLGMELARSETIVFSEGNILVRVLENVRDAMSSSSRAAITRSTTTSWSSCSGSMP